MVEFLEHLVVYRLRHSPSQSLLNHIRAFLVENELRHSKNYAVKRLCPKPSQESANMVNGHDIGHFFNVHVHF
ncbi:hypothetical protein AFERRI_80041 [Acidithiobacillus ferrivorans]|uniref:Uncharacterized protein n=1 Tax=Acidithiobacillus ferrivorans TaxID=160808 RepID=A0A060UU09_9PROT|nr:hypothetical protein AFERRI_80041 [Acidithiobacillus ferrivorans]